MTELNTPTPEDEWEDPLDAVRAAPYQELMVQDGAEIGPVARTVARLLARSGAGAIAWAYAQHFHRSRNWVGMCLMFVRMCFNVGSRYPSAESAYNNAQQKETSWPPPAGVPVFWTNGRYGHIALSAGNGWVWTTDFLRTGSVDKARINSITAGWHQHYRGWTKDLNGVPVYRGSVTAKALPKISLHNVLAAQRGDGTGVNHGRLLKKAVAAEVGKGSMSLLNRKLGRGFDEQYKLVQQKFLRAAGERVTGVNADGVPGRSSLAWLGNRHGFEVK